VPTEASMKVATPHRKSACTAFSNAFIGAIVSSVSVLPPTASLCQTKLLRRRSFVATLSAASTHALGLYPPRRYTRKTRLDLISSKAEPSRRGTRLDWLSLVVGRPRPLA
jgi:hypothetical protein